jgi:hypothetical protein
MALQKKAVDVATMNEISSFIESESNPLAQRSRLLRVVGQAGTRETMDIVIGMATSSSNETLRQVAAQCVSDGASFRSDGGYHEDLSPALERLWTSSDDEHLLVSAAVVMGTLGAPSGVAILVDAAADSSPRNAFRARTAQYALLEVTNPKAIPGLAARLATQSTVNSESSVVINTLMVIDKPDAAKPMIAWFQRADKSAAALARRCAAYPSSDKVKILWGTAADPAANFASEDVREGIRQGLVDLSHRYRRDTPTGR